MLARCSRQGLLANRDSDGRAQLTHMGAAVYASCMPSEQAMLLFRMLQGARTGRQAAASLIGRTFSLFLWPRLQIQGSSSC